MLGIILVIIGQCVRSLAMATASTNFHHFVQERHAVGHVLITKGIYSTMRHPSYFGFFHWTIGTQLLLSNWICLVVHPVVLWFFFKDRIEYEEEYLLEWFEKDYEQYRQNIWSGMYWIR